MGVSIIMGKIFEVFFYIFEQFSFTASKRKVEFYHQKFIIGVASQSAEWLKT